MIKKLNDRSKAEKKEERRMAVSMGVLNVVKGDTARGIIQKLDNPTSEQMLRKEELSARVRQFAGFIKT